MGNLQTKPPMQRLQSFLITFLRRHAGRASALLALDLTANLLIVALSVTAAQVYTGLLGMGSARGRLLADFGLGKDFGSREWLYVFGALIVLRAGADWSRKAIRGVLGEDFSYALRRLLFGHQLNMERKHYTEKGAGRYLLRFSGDLNSVQALFTRGILRALGDLTLVAGSLALFFYLDAGLAAVVAVALIVLSCGLFFLNRAAGRVDSVRRDKKSGLLAYVSRHLPHVAAVQATNRRRPVWEGFERRARRLATVGRRYWWRAASVEAVVPLGLYGGLWLVLFLLFQRPRTAVPEPDVLLVFILLLLSWRPVLGRLLRVGLTWEKGLISGRKLARLLDRSSEGQPNLPDVRVPLGPLVLKDVGLTYGAQTVFRGVSLRLEVGEIILLTATSGEGKTSLSRLLAGCTPVTEGEVYQGKHSLAGTNLKSWRRQLTFVSPAFPLFGATLEHSLSYSRRRKYRTETQRVFAEWQTRFPVLQSLHLRQRLGDNCENLTRGQETLLRWLRAVLAGKPYLVVDEGLVGLDALSQRILLSWLNDNRSRYGILWLDHPGTEMADFFGARPQVLGKDKGAMFLSA